MGHGAEEGQEEWEEGCCWGQVGVVSGTVSVVAAPAVLDVVAAVANTDIVAVTVVAIDCTAAATCGGVVDIASGAVTLVVGKAIEVL